MPNIENKTAFVAEVFGQLDSTAREHFVIVLKASFVATPDTQPVIAERQAPVVGADEYRTDPGFSSLRMPSDIAMTKPGVDVIVTGHAYAPAENTTAMQVGLHFGDRIHKQLLVSGDRFWRTAVPFRVPSSPAPFEIMPVVYERAFGGREPYEPRNPAGVGFRGALSMDPEITTEVPNIEHWSSSVRAMESQASPAGFGAIAPGWQPRVRYAGTYDDAWLQDQAPLLPHDFDARFFMVAPEDQRVPAIRGGELVEITGMTSKGDWRFALPMPGAPVHLVYRDRIEKVQLTPDTVHVEPDHYRITITARAVVPVIRNRAPLDQIVIGAVHRAWWRARFARKAYRPHKEPSIE